MLRNMVTSFFQHKKIVTTVDKAKALKPLIDKLVNLAKKGDLNSYRRGLMYLTKRSILKAMFKDASEGRLGADRDSGYASMARTELRKGDAASMVQLTLITKTYTKASSGKGGVKSVDRARRVAASKASLKETPQSEKPSASDIDRAVDKAIDNATDMALNEQPLNEQPLNEQPLNEPLNEPIDTATDNASDTLNDTATTPPDSDGSSTDGNKGPDGSAGV
jgi:large subunit ribosomal protein L17